MFDELLNLSKKIINGYQELEKLITEITIKSATNFEVNQDAVMKYYLVYDSLIKSYSSIVDKFNSNITKLINAKVKELRELIIEENKLLNSLTEDEVDSFIKTLEKIDTNNDDCIARLRERLMVRGYILEGYSFRGDKILNNNKDDSVFDDEEPNYEFEIEETNDDYYDSLYEEASEVIDIIVSIDPNTKDIEEYFELLYYFTCLEVIIESMNIDELTMTKEQILEMNLDDSNNLYRDARDENKNPNMKLVRKLIDRKLDEEKN